VGSGSDAVNYREGTKFNTALRADGEEAQGGAATPVKTPSQIPAPGIKSEADSGSVSLTSPPSSKEPEKRSFFERMFGPKTKSPTNPSSTTPSPQRANP
jgi:hypothetical protein